jgi:putative hydrolase of the HAD superfamily
VPTLIFDADDTLWENNVVYERVARDFFAWLAHPDEAHARAVRQDVERANVAAHGYGTAVFLRTLHDTVERLRDRPPTLTERAEVDALAAALAHHEMELVPGVVDVLTALGRRHDLRLLTKGSPAEQHAKIDASGLAGHFASVHVVAEKDVATYRGLVAELSLRPAETWMIGNSPRSDVLPARAAGLHAVYVPNPHTWAHEHAVIDDPAVVTVASLRDLTRLFDAT